MTFYLKNHALVEVGVWLDGAAGWRNIGRLIELAETHGMELNVDDRENLKLFFAGGDDFDDFDEVMWLSEQAEDFLNGLIPDDQRGKYYFGWDDGEFVLAETDDEDE